MNDYSNYALRGVIAGLITGITTSAIHILIPPTVVELTEAIINSRIPQNIPPEELEKLISNIKNVVNSLTPITPIVQVVQQLILGSLFGVLHGSLTLRLKIRELTSALITGIVYTSTLNLIPLIVMHNLMPETMELLIKYLGLNTYLIITSPGISFTTSLTLLSIAKGFSNKLMSVKHF